MQIWIPSVADRWSGGVELAMDFLPGTTLRVYQPFMRFSADAAANGVVLGFAAMPDPATLPAKNLSRGAGASLNYNIQDRLDFDGTGPKLTDIFVLFLAARDRDNAGMVKEIAVAVVDSAYEGYLFYEDIELFVASYSDVLPAEVAAAAPKTEGFKLKLRDRPKAFEPPEAQMQDVEGKKKQEK